MPELSVCIPVYNEARVVEQVLTGLIGELSDRVPDFEVIVVDDASTDETPAIIDRLAAADARIRVHHAATNRGHGPTLRAALEASRGAWIFQLDSDAEQPPSDFWLLWERRYEADLVMGTRTTLRHGMHRTVVSAAARTTTRLLGCGRMRDVNVPFKLLRRPLWDDVAVDMPAAPVTPSILIAAAAAWRGWRIEQVAVSHRQRTHAPSSMHLRRIARMSAGSLRELVAYRRRSRRRPRGDGVPAAAEQRERIVR